MKINFERTFTAPFTAGEDGNIKNIYLTAAGITLLGFVLIGIMQGISQVVVTFAQAIAGSNDVTSALIAGILAIVVSLLSMGVSLVALALPFGYVTETVKLEVYDRKSIMPSWSGNYMRFFWNGVKFQLIMFIYSFILALIVIIPIILLVAILGVSLHDKQEMAAVAGGIGGIVIMLIIMVLIFAYMFILPMILTHFAAEGRFLAAFNIFKIIGKILSNLVDYIIAIVVVIGLGIMASIVYMLLCITCVGLLAIPVFAYFLLPIIMLNLFAQIYKE
ncbi:MAG: DUF4013 domain-containing protein [Vampirovibrionia bacterium]